MALVVKCLPYKHKALTLNSGTARKNRKTKTKTDLSFAFIHHCYRMA
jgi:hypothetical protein